MPQQSITFRQCGAYIRSVAANVVKDANGQTLAYVYGNRETRADADIAHVLTLERLSAS